MKTEKLYQKNRYQTECDTVALEVISDPESLKSLGLSRKQPLTCIVCGASVFFSTGGGQPCDLGTILVDNSITLQVLDVFEQDGAIYHAVTQTDAVKPGSPLHLTIDWPRRFSHMQRHCGEHILSGAFDRLFGGVNRGFHMGDDYMTIDVSLEKDPSYSQITWEMAKEAERFANQVIWDNAPVSVHHFRTKTEAADMPVRKPLTIEEDISIVCVGDPSQPSDCVACCGTHPATAGQVGIIKILKLENYKGMTRVYLKAGHQAFEDYVCKHEIITSLSNRNSTEPEKLLEAVEKQEKRNQETRQELSELKRYLTEQAQDEILHFYQHKELWIKPEKPDAEVIHRVNASEMPLLIARKSFPNLKTDDIQSLGRKAAQALEGLLILISEKEHTAVLFSNGTPDCGRLVRDNASICQGKGGGNPTCARAIFSSSESVETYIDLIEKHLR